MDCILKKHKRLLASKNTIPILTLSPGEFLFSDGTFINESSSPSRTKVLEENAVIHFADVSPYSEVENGLLVTVSNDRIIGYPVSRSQDGSADIGLPTLLGEDMGPVTALSIGLNKKWIAVGTTKGGVLLLRLRLEWFRNNFKILGVHQKGSLEDYSVTHISFVPNRSNKDSSECILVLLTSENNLKLWRVGDALLICDFELSSQLGRYPLTSLTVQNHIIVIGNSQGTLFFHHLLSSSKSDFFTRVIGTVHLAETFQLEQEFFHRDLNQNGNCQTTGFKNNVPYFSSSFVDVGCEILDMTFYGGKMNEETQNNNEKPPCLIIGTSVGIVSMNVRTRELISIIPFHQLFTPDEGNMNILDSMANGLCINRHSSSFYKARNTVGIVVQTATDGKTWSLNIELEVLKRRRENSEYEEDEDETLRILSGELSFVAKDSILEGSFFNKYNRIRKKRMGMLSKSVPNLGRVFDMSKQKIRSSGYGNQSNKKRKMFQPFTNSYRQYEKSLAKIFPSSTSSSPAFPSSILPEPLGNSPKDNLMERARWSMRSSALNGSSKFCKNEKTVITFLSSGSRSSSSLANKEASELPEILSQSNKIWTGDGVLSRLKFSPNGKYIGSYGSEKSAQILNVNGKEGVHLVGHTGPVNSIDFSHSRGYSVLTCGTDKTVRLWDWKARVNKVTIGGDHGYDTSGLSSKLSIYRNKLSGHRVKYDKLRFGKDEVNKSSFYYLDQFILSGAGNALYVHSLEGIDSDYKEDIKITQIDTFVFPNAKNVLDFYASNSCFSHIALISCSDKSLKVFDLNYGKVCLNIPRAHSRPILSIARSEGALYKMEEEIGENEDHNLFGTYTLGDGVKIWDIRSVESCVQRCDWPGSDRGGRIASSIDMSPCSKYLIVGGEDGGVYVFDLRMTSSFCSRLVGGTSSSPITGVVFNTTTTSNIFATNLQGELFQFKNKGS